MAKKKKKVTNGGSAIGEAIGANMEMAVQDAIEQFLENYACHFLRQTGKNPITGRTSKKLYLYDEYNNKYDFDGVVTDEDLHPLILLESKYIRYKKHNRDKGSWICNAHTAVRKKYPSIRASIAVLAGNWSAPSLAMLKSYDVNCFVIPFDKIIDILSKRGIDFNWEEADDKKAMDAWKKYLKLSYEDQYSIGEEMIDIIKEQLFSFLTVTLSNDRLREIRKIIIEILTSIGETKRFIFNDKEEAIEFLDTIDLDEEFNGASFLTIYDSPDFNIED